MGTDVSVWRAGELQAGWRLTTWWMFCGCEFGCFVGERRKRNKMEMVDPQNIASANVCVIRSDPGVSAHSTKPVHVHCMT